MAELHLKLFYLFTFATGTVIELNLIVIVRLQDLIHTLIKHSQWFDHRMGRLKDAIGAQDQ